MAALTAEQYTSIVAPVQQCNVIVLAEFAKLKNMIAYTGVTAIEYILILRSMVAQ